MVHRITLGGEPGLSRLILSSCLQKALWMLSSPTTLQLPKNQDNINVLQWTSFPKLFTALIHGSPFSLFKKMHNSSPYTASFWNLGGMMKESCHSSWEGEKPFCLLCLITNSLCRKHQKTESGHRPQLLLLVPHSPIVNRAAADKACQGPRASRCFTRGQWLACAMEA